MVCDEPVAVRRHVGLLHRARAADVRQVQRDAGDQLAHALDGAAGRHRVEHFARSAPATWSCSARRRSATAPVTVSVSSSAPTFRSVLIVMVKFDCELDAFALDRGETCERERHRVDAGPQIDEAIARRSHR